MNWGLWSQLKFVKTRQQRTVKQYTEITITFKENRKTIKGHLASKSPPHFSVVKSENKISKPAEY